jgi:hypothetical protein
MLKTSLSALSLVAVVSLNLHAQRPPVPGRGPSQPQVRAAFKSSDAKAGTITVTVPGAQRGELIEKTYTLAKNVEVGTGTGLGGRGSVLKEIKLADIPSGTTVVISLSANEKTAEFILAEGSQVRGQLKAVDSMKNTITVALQQSRRDEAGEEKTYTVATDADIALDDGRLRRFSIRESKLADLPTGAIVSLWLSVDHQQAQAILAEGPMLSGHIKAVDAGKNTLTLTTNQRDAEPEERTLDVARSAIIILDDGKGRRFSLKPGKLADLPAGAMVSLKLSADQKRVALIQAAGPMVSGRLKSIDGAKGMITIEIFVKRGENPEEKTYSLAKDVQVVVEGKQAKLTDVKTEDVGFTTLQLSLDQMTVQRIMVSPPRR